MNSRNFWDKCLRAYDALNSLTDYRVCLEHAVQSLGAAPGQLVLDAGSGTGNLSVRLKQTGARVFSLDFSPVALEIHREKDPAAEVFLSSLEAPLPFESASFDRVACLSVLFSLTPDGVRRALDEFRRVLKPDGTLVVTVMRPGTSKLAALWSHYRGRFRSMRPGAFLGEARRTLPPLLRMLYYNYLMYLLAPRKKYRRFTYDELREEIVRAGFAISGYETTYGGRFHLVQARAAAAAG